MLIDIFFLVMMLIAIFKGMRNGLIVAVFSMAGWILGLIAAIKFSGIAAELLRDSLDIAPKWLSVIAFLIVFSLVLLLVNIGAKLIEKTVELAMLGWINKLGGIFFYVLLYTLIFSVIIYFADTVKLLSEETISSSRVYQILRPGIITLKRLL